LNKIFSVISFPFSRFSLLPWTEADAVNGSVKCSRHFMDSRPLISLVVHFPSRFRVQLSIPPTATVSNLRARIPTGSCNLMHNGQLLIDAMTLAFYGLCEMDTLVVMPCQTTDIHRGLCEDRIRWPKNSGTARETARIRDMAFTRAERRPRSFRRLCVSAESASYPWRSASGVIALTTEYPTVSAPSCDPLPAPWVTASQSARIGPETRTTGDDARPRHTTTPSVRQTHQSV
jgi:hypothetical protein